MSDIQLGQLITKEGKRDAIHVALAPVVAGQRLVPGQHIGFLREFNTATVGVCSDPIGIVDPFLEHTVEKGQQFYMLLYQNTVTGMTHAWEHPSFAKPGASASERWMRELAQEIGREYEWLLDNIPSGSIYTGDEDNSGIRDSEDIKMHYENITGRRAPSEVYFRCAC